ncbi:MAG: heme-binding protein [Terrimicrobiaceae bacterium]
MRPILSFMNFWSLLALSLLGLGTFASCSISRAGYESAPYQVIENSPPFQVRDYPPLRVVETRMEDNTGDSGFQKLFRFISGRNSENKKIAMTTPVFMEGSGEARIMAFYLPSAVSPSAPTPADPMVNLRVIPAGRFAVLRFGGSRSTNSEENQLSKLNSWILRRGWKTDRKPIFAYYDPPWTPGFLRRNEVMLRLVD